MEVILVLDTNAYSDWRRSGKWKENLARADRVVVPAVVLGELEFGFLKGSKTEQNRRLLRDFLRQPQVEVLPVTHRTARIYGEFVLHLKERGRPIPINDIWIAAQAEESGGELAARDGHFDELPMIARAEELLL